MEESLVPPPQSTTEQPLRIRHRLLRAAIPIIIVIIVIIVGLLLAGPIHREGAAAKQAHLLLDNQAKSQLILTNSAGKPLFSFNYPQFSYMHFEAASPKGEILLSRSLSATSRSYTLMVGGKAESLPAASTTALNSAIVVGGTNRLYFTDENSVAYVSCAKTCKLMLLNLTSGNTRTIIDTGIKPLIPQLPPVWPLGVSADHKSVYLRTVLAGKLGKKAAAVYALSLSGKVVTSWEMPSAADYTPSLSPDAKKIVYRVDDFNAKSTKISVLDLIASKVFPADWKGGEIVDQPDSFSWSPDSKKVAFWGSNSILPHLDQSASFDINLAYLDTTNSRISTVETIKDSVHNQIAKQSWLDNKNLIYERDTTKTANDFTQATSNIYKENVAGKTSSQLSNLSGRLLETVYY